MSGVRYRLERARGGDATLWRYEGFIETEGRQWSVAFELAEGEVRVLHDEAPDPYLQFAATLLRLAARSAAKRGQPPPRRLHRWRTG